MYGTHTIWGIRGVLEFRGLSGAAYELQSRVPGIKNGFSGGPTPE